MFALNYFSIMQSLEKEWIQGNITLGAAAQWSSDEIRLVSELGYALAEQGRNAEAIAIFEGLVALAPATAYFESALGALWLREKNYRRAIQYLNKALESDAKNIPSRVNRGEAHLQLGELDQARIDLEFVLKQNIETKKNKLLEQCKVRAKALLFAVERINKSE